MNLASVGTVILAVLAGIGLIVALLGWFFKRGADEREMTIAVRENTAATRDLTVLFNDFRAAVTDRFHVHDIRLAEHDGRLNRLEANDVRPVDRNASPQA